MYAVLNRLLQTSSIQKLSIWMVIGMACFVLYSNVYHPYFVSPSNGTSEDSSLNFVDIDETQLSYNDDVDGKSPRTKVRLETAPPLPSYLSVCTVMKNEASYIDEWIHFHMLAGVERFFIYNDNSTDQSVDILKDYVKAGWVVLENAKILYDKKTGRSMTKLSSYKHCLEKYGHHTRWMTFIDMSEFLFSPGENKLPTTLSDFENFPAVHVRSVIFGSSGHLTKPNGFVIENYLYRAPLMKDNSKDVLFNIKSIVHPGRTKLCDLDDPVLCSFPFCFEGVNKTEEILTEEHTLYPVNENMKKILIPSPKGLSTIDRLRVNVYRKSYEEYLSQKKQHGKVEECDAKFLKLGRIWKEVDVNDEKDVTVLSLLDELKTDLGFPADQKVPIPPIESHISYTNNIVASPSGEYKAVSPSQRFTVLLLSTGGSAGSYLAHILNVMNSNTIQKPSVLQNLQKELTLQQVGDPNQLSLGFDISLQSVFQRSFFAELGTVILRKIHFSTRSDLDYLLPTNFPEIVKTDPLPLFGYLYDARLPVFAPLWRELIGDKKTVCVVLNTNPEILSGHYKKGYPSSDPQKSSPVNDLLISWEKYTTASLKACQGVPTIIVHESELIENPYKAILRLHYNLVNTISEGNDERIGVKLLSEHSLILETNDWCDLNQHLNLPFCYYVQGEYNIFSYYEKSKDIPFGSVSKHIKDLYSEIESGFVFKHNFGNYDDPTFAQDEKKIAF
eukprot:TRINITY_DN1170_c0_g1_i1.p1 TRINITY_DN1170_c0_g1~~TRINITY_DN1170_c0_g1_i1.p1  ORF type:complete len:728 (-),score=90.88 TRINITY_DN1170_c0_g1_i1:34-2217(-)